MWSGTVAYFTVVFPMLFLRSLVFNILWYINLIVQMVVQTPIYFFLSHKEAVKVPQRWARSTHALHRWIVGTRIEITGTENIPQGGAIVAAKHQSLWDFYSIYEQLPDSAFVLKSELMKIPFFGWYVAKLRHIPISRGDRSKAMRTMMGIAEIEIVKGRQILIFPEGTRRAPGAEPAYRYGVTRMYEKLDCPVVPVALTSGLYWPRRTFMRFPGVIRMRFLPPIPPGLPTEEFSKRVADAIEEGCLDLYRETLSDQVQPPRLEAIIADHEKNHH
ncbi:MAG: lysophospholipid acyltransferase family protein [Pseudomonadota bacterium]